MDWSLLKTKVLIFALGAAIGSILNTLIYRLPRGQSLLQLLPECSHCGMQRRGVIALPVVGWLITRGRCPRCGGLFSIRHPVVEILSGTLFLLLWLQTESTAQIIRYGIFNFLLISLFFTDLEHRRLPDVLTLPGIGLGLLFSFLLGNPVASLTGTFVGGGVLLAIVVISRGGMGMGDVKLEAMIGAFLGLGPMLASLVTGIVLGGVIALLLLLFKIRGPRDMIPYGPFLITGAWLVMLGGERLGVQSWSV